MIPFSTRAGPLASAGGPARGRQPGPVVSSAPVTDPRFAAPGGLRQSPASPGLPDPNVAPPVVAEPGDLFAVLRVLELVARVERGRPVLLDDLVASLNARYLDWVFNRAVVVDALVGLHANWMADFRNASGIVLEDGPYGPALTLEETARVSAWLVGQAQRTAARCREQLAEFSRRDGPNRSG